MREAEPSTPVEVIGLDALPEVGDNFQVVTDTAKAKQIVMYRESKTREQAMSKNNRITLEMLHDQVKEGDAKNSTSSSRPMSAERRKFLAKCCRSFRPRK